MSVFINRKVKQNLFADKNTILLLKGDSLEDQSRYKVQLENSGVTINTNNSKFGSSLYFNGSSYFALTGLKDFPSGIEDFTIDFWFYDNSSPSSSAIFSHAFSAGVGYGCLFYYKNNNILYTYTSDTPNTWNGSNSKQIGTSKVNQWTHYALVRYNKYFYTFQDGILQTNYLDNTNFKNLNGIPYIGKYDYQTGYYIKGYLERFRISNIARWTSNFNSNYILY